jgi:hypothetical protein
MRGAAFSRCATGTKIYLLLNKSFDQTFSKVWPPAGTHHVGRV